MPEHALVVDGDRVQQEDLAGLLQAEGYCTHVAATSVAAREVLRTQAVNVILLAPQLPDGDGRRFCDELRETLGPRVVIVVLLPPGPAMNRVVMLELGADDAITLPIGADELLARIAAHRRRRTLTDL